MNLNPKYSPRTHLNLNVRGLSQSATLAINERCAGLIRDGKEVFRFGLGQSPFPIPLPIVEALKANAHQKDYLPVKGLPALREAIVGYYQRTEGLDYSPDKILVGPGSKELMFIVQLVYYGDLVIPTPSWVSYAPQASIIGRHLRWLPTQIETGLGVTPEALNNLCQTDPERPRLLILNYPGNPSGMTYSAAQLKAIAKVARRYRVLVLADEIYSELHFEGKHISIARFYPEGTLISNGLSKWCGAGGWRLGAFIFPQSLTWLLESMAAVASETFTSTSAPIQYAAVEAFRGSTEIKHYTRQVRRLLHALTRFAARRLRDIGAAVADPQGAFYLFPNFDPLREQLCRRSMTNSEILCTRLLEETGVAILPGSVFGRPLDELSARLACVDFDGGKALAALEALPDTTEPNEAFLRTYCYPVVHGIERLCNWLS
ncbi:aminotransferase class I and II [Nitrosococcus halophilus Nc 4]|uniref:Aminotransferase n=1 Tax=Nitrosococcus halophilus (strain Nc4) TaxID=472759 RepID=D5BZY7_NITHN|nr:aminotransferase class I/II-fold pyridoxal phosphate-dependent enzyme [Nitrosococcus halophilus]ADE16234.1 aminotransferase class I and II [Nitrosococcus halophilus Nc 4]